MTDVLHSRSRLIAAARPLFQQWGFERTRTADIARRAGMSETQMSRLFSGKVGLLNAVLTQIWEDVLGAPPIDQDRSSLEALIATLDHLFMSLSPGDALLVSCEDGRSRGGGNVVFRSAGSIRWRETIQELIRRGRLDGGISQEGTDSDLAEILLGIVEISMREWAIRTLSDVKPLVPRPDLSRIVRRLLGP